MAESVERGLRVREIVTSFPSGVNLLTYKIDTCRFLAWLSAFIQYCKDLLVQCQDNVIECDIESWCWQPDFTLGQHYKVTMSVHYHKSVPVLI